MARHSPRFSSRAPTYLDPPPDAASSLGYPAAIRSSAIATFENKRTPHSRAHTQASNWGWQQGLRSCDNPSVSIYRYRARVCGRAPLGLRRIFVPQQAEQRFALLCVVCCRLQGRQQAEMHSMAYRSSWLTGRRGIYHAATAAARRRRAPTGGRNASSSSYPAASAEDLDGVLSYAVPKVAVPTLAVVGSNKRFPVRRVYCVGSNYRCVWISMCVCLCVFARAISSNARSPSVRASASYLPVHGHMPAGMPSCIPAYLSACHAALVLLRIRHTTEL